MTQQHEVVLTKSETFLKSAMNALERQVSLGISPAKNFDAKGALGYTALKIMESPYQIGKEVIIDTMIRIAQKGLDPRKDQIYILPNKKGQIMLMESYFGYEKLAYDIEGVKKGSIHSDVVRKGEIVIFEGRTLKHEKTLDTLDNDIIGAYSKVTIDGEEIAQYMTAYQISLSWSKTNSVEFNAVEETRKGQYGPYTVNVADVSKIEKGKLTAFNKNQRDFPVDMCKRTVIKNLLKPFIKSHAEPTIAGAYSMEENDAEVIKEAEVIEDWSLEEVSATKEIPETVKETDVPQKEEDQTQQTEEVEDLKFDI